MNGTPLLAGRALHKSFGSTPALRGLQIEIGAGEVVAVMGPSGSGKSTLLHCLAGILTPDSGEVYFDGQRIDNLGDGQRSVLRRTVFGFVFQFGQLVPELPVLDNVALPLLLGGRRRSTAERAARPWLARLGLDEVAARRPATLSGGQGQRVALARALIAKPRIIFADEPTGSLDTVSSDDVMELLVQTAKEERAGVVVVTHEPRVAAFADRTVRLRDGQVVASTNDPEPDRWPVPGSAGLIVETGPVTGPSGELLR